MLLSLAIAAVCVYAACPKCSNEYNPVCGSNDITYINSCFLETMKCEKNIPLTVKSIGICPQSIQCPSKCTPDGSLYAPVCGTDGIMYDSPCHFQQAWCFNSSLIVASLKCTCELNDPCPNDISPICGSNNATYGNQCLFDKAQCLNENLEIVDYGGCKNKSSSKGPSQDDTIHFPSHTNTLTVTTLAILVGFIVPLL